MVLKLRHFKYSRIFAYLLIVLFVGFSSCKGKKNNTKKLQYKGIAKVFNVDKEAVKYTLTIYVDQPGAGGDREKFEFSGLAVDAGHAFIKLEREHADGTKTAIIVGFYPDKLPHPNKPETGGYLGDDTGKNFEVQKEYTVNKENFHKALDYVESIGSSKKKYHLNDYNCADFVIQTAKAAGVDVPDTQGSWSYDSSMTGSLSGSGSNPGDLGEDLR